MSDDDLTSDPQITAGAQQYFDQPAQPPTNIGGRPKGKSDGLKARADRKTAKILELAAKNVDIATIAAATGLDRTTVRKRIKRYSQVFVEIRNVPAFQSARATLLNAAELTLLKSCVSPSAIRKASLNNRAYTYRQVHDARRLEEGKSTANVATQQIRVVELVELDTPCIPAELAPVESDT